MRTLEELYTLLYVSFRDRVYGKGPQFVCCLINDFFTSNIITGDEYFLLLDNFKANRPTQEQHPLFYNHSLYLRNCINWFGIGQNAYHTRTEFLNYLIKNHVS